MKIEDKIILEQMMNFYSVKEITQTLADICLAQASKMIDYELPSSAKDWSEVAFIIQTIVDQIKK
jgi:hypothetical protein